MRQRNIRVMAHPSMPVAPANPAGLYLNDHPVFARDWVWHILDREWFCKFLINGCSHAGFSPPEKETGGAFRFK
jgi:hypothetical protein